LVEAAAWLLDVTRLVSRLGRGQLTGIDRVELAYLSHLLAQQKPVFGLVRTALGFVMLDRNGMRAVLNRVTGQEPLGQADMLARLTQRHLPQNPRAEADLRRMALARCLRPGLTGMVRRVLPQGAVYVNVGHANLSSRVMRSVKAVPGAKTVVMIHDTIPLDYPQYCRPGMAAVHAAKLAVVGQFADRVVHTARCTQAQTEAHFAKLGRIPPGVVAPLGVSVGQVRETASSAGRRPYFVVLGTIEPRKNIGLLIKVWAQLQKTAGPVPHLYIVGNKGWAEPNLFTTIDALVASGAASLCRDLDDDAVAALLTRAEALLFPSFAEGFGLPPLEAASLGVPVLSGKLPVVVEMLSDYPVYLDTSDVYAWVNAINQTMKRRTFGPKADRQIYVPPSWADHFDLVFSPA
jgi:glycosyltransferase involved in cell wall biosynthesis